MAEVDMDTMPAQIAKARASGYSDDQIYSYLAQQAPEQFARATAAGHSSADILAHLSGSSPAVTQAQPAQTQPAQTQSEPEKPPSWSDLPGNIGPSTGRLVGDVYQTFRHPVETLTNMKNLGLGILEKTGIAGTILPPTGGGHEQYAEAVGKYFMDRYGSMEAVKKAIITDPIGVAADATALLTGGETALARAPGILGKVGEVAGAAGRAVDPVARAGQLIQGAGKLAAYPIGVTTGVGETPFLTAAAAGREGGPAAQALRESMRGKADIAQPVQDARGAIANMREQRGIDYNAGMAPIKGDATVLDFKKIDNAMDYADKSSSFSGRSGTGPPQVGYPGAESARSQIKGLIDNWKSLDPAEFHTPEGLDFLKKQISDVLQRSPPNTQESRVAGMMYNAVKQTIVDQSPGYAKVMKGYEDASNLIHEIESTLSQGKGANIDTALRKLQSVMRNNVQTNYGRRTDLANMLVANGAPNLMEKLAGQSLSSFTPRGLARVAPILSEAGAVGLGLKAGGLAAAIKGGAALAPALAFASPRLMGEAAYLGGVGARYAPLAQLGLQYGRQPGRLPGE
jgi:hypothetical protein